MEAQQQQNAKSVEHTPLLIIGAGPFGLAMAAHARNHGVDHVVVGQPMSFWRDHMPTGMLLRSGCDWHLDPAGRDTIERFLEIHGKAPENVTPLPLSCYLDYAEWFQEENYITPRPSHVTQLDMNNGALQATLDDGAILTADHVLLAIGFAPFANTPEELAALVPAEQSSHTCDSVIPEEFVGQRLLIVGGRQSAFESASLLAEAGVEKVHVCHRHETPAFTDSDWSWVNPLLQRIANEPRWYRSLPDTERKELDYRFWTEGRLKLEPWLGPRVQHEAITIHPETRLRGSAEIGNSLRVSLDDGKAIEVDHVLFATGYKVNLQHVSFLRAGNLIDQITCNEGFPVLDEHLQTSVPGLCITSLPATRNFGLFFAFTAAVRASAQIVGRRLD